jgi:hypothetical protein
MELLGAGVSRTACAHQRAREEGGSIERMVRNIDVKHANSGDDRGVCACSSMFVHHRCCASVFIFVSECVKQYSGRVNTRFCSSSCFSVLHAGSQYIVAGSEDGAILWWTVNDSSVVHTMRDTKPKPPASSQTPPAGASTTPSSSVAVICVDAHPTLKIVASATMEYPYSIVLWKHHAKKR